MSIVSAGIVVYKIENNQPRYLLLQHSRGGHWDFPKGKVEEGESLQQTALRELQEEAGICAHIVSGFIETITYQIVYSGVSMNKIVHFFIGIASHFDIVLSSEHLQGGWFSYQKALETLTYESSRAILKNAQKVVGR